MNVDIHHRTLVELGKLADTCQVEIYIVGGYLRDVLMGRKTKDIDISVVGDGVDFARQAAGFFGKKKVVVFERFGTARIQVGDSEIEFVGTRTERYDSLSRKPIVETGSIYDDLLRRDFTVNAIAASLNKDTFGALLDPFNGRYDIESRILRTPQDPEKTFSEDPLRMMRAFRFAAQLEFDIDESALDAIKRINDRIAIVSTERVRDEFLKILETPKPSIGLAPMQETGVMKHFFPELNALAGIDQRTIEDLNGSKSYHHKDVFFHTLQVVDNISEMTENIWLRLAAVLHDIAKPRTKAFRKDQGWTFHGHAEIGARMTASIFHRLRLPLEQMKYVEKIVALHLRPISLVGEDVTDSAIRRLLFDSGNDIDDLLMLCRADITSKNPKLVSKYLNNYDRLLSAIKEIEDRDQLRNWQPPLSGDEIMEICDIKPGIAVGVLKSQIEDAILDGVIPNNKHAALEYLMSIKDEVLNKPVIKKPHTLKKMLKRLPENLKP